MPGGSYGTVMTVSTCSFIYFLFCDIRQNEICEEIIVWIQKFFVFIPFVYIVAWGRDDQALGQRGGTEGCTCRATQSRPTRSGPGPWKLIWKRSSSMPATAAHSSLLSERQYIVHDVRVIVLCFLSFYFDYLLRLLLGRSRDSSGHFIVH